MTIVTPEASDCEDLPIPTRLGTLHVRRRGDGPLVVLWPSLLMDGTLWDGVTAQLSRRWTTLALDPPGHGRSEPLRRSFTLDECAGVLLDVLDHAEVETAHVVGNSWGGMVGATFAARHGDRLGAAVLMNATGSSAGRLQRLEFAAMLGMGRLLGGIRPPLTRSVLKAFLGPTSLRERPEVVQHVREAAQRVDLDSVAWAVRRSTGPCWWSRAVRTRRSRSPRRRRWLTRSRAPRCGSSRTAPTSSPWSSPRSSLPASPTSSPATTNRLPRRGR
ncbi:hypothetical protein GCM10009710_24180 [Aeromicrobium alkaliterrae]|uniref:AB hydrolase-1 domain-containing protein n=1 Tax=Aeromicrobium alkaliterrae TaxID=302168 RepID=A0ABN2JY59_9ACTN